MQNGPDFSALANVTGNAHNFLCFIHPQATYDAVAAALALQLALTESGRGCEVVCDEPMRVEYSHLVGIDKVHQDAGNRDLVVSFEYNEDQVDKVSYNVDEEKKRFELVIAPKSGALPLDPATVEFHRSGLAADVVFLFGYHAFAELGPVYEKEKYTIDSAFTVAFTQSQITPYAKLHLTLQADQFSYSEMVYFLVRQLQLAEVKDDMATNLLSGIEYATDRLTLPTITARTFETVANLMRRGGQRQPQNPAYQYLGMPIRQPKQYNADGELQSQVRVPNTATSGQWNSTDTVEDDFAPMTMPAATPVSKNATVMKGQPVSPSEFARAMSARS